MRCREADDPFTKLGQYLFALHSLAARFSRMITLEAACRRAWTGAKNQSGEWWGGPPGPRATPPPACWRPAWGCYGWPGSGTRASRADQGVRPTIWPVSVAGRFSWDFAGRRPIQTGQEACPTELTGSAGPDRGSGCRPN